VTLRFGTDGVRGLVGADLTPELTLALGRVAARVLARPGRAPAAPDLLPAPGGTDGPVPAGPGGRPRFVIGRDTRRSGPMLQAALTAGLTAEGVDVVDVGVLPTPGVATMAAAYQCPAAVISASHNPFPDNGIKLFEAGGRKLDDDAETEIEDRLAALVGGLPDRSGRTGPGTADRAPVEPGSPPVTGAAIGTVRIDHGALGWYRRQLAAGLEGRRLDGIRVVVDCGHGAASVTAVAVLEAAGAEVVEAIGVAPDGSNINDGVGSTDPSGLARAVVAHHAAVGLAFDGDADRLIAVDGDGRIVDGDRLLALFALDYRRRGRLAAGTVVVTVMTNLGFHRAMADAGITVHATPVGDRHVLAALDAHHWSLGGEQSGHLIFRDLATTGDGVLSGLLLLDLLIRADRSLAEMAGAVMRRFPQVLHNVGVTDRDGLDGADLVWAEVARIEAELGGAGRVLLRPSGTESLVRVMVEAETEEAAAGAADQLVAAVRRALGPAAPA
jgi:phosphoglucosamine mutase